MTGIPVRMIRFDVLYKPDFHDQDPERDKIHHGWDSISVELSSVLLIIATNSKHSYFHHTVRLLPITFVLFDLCFM